MNTMAISATIMIKLMAILWVSFCQVESSSAPYQNHSKLFTPKRSIRVGMNKVCCDKGRDKRYD